MPGASDLTDAELAALDLLIALKRDGKLEPNFLGDIVLAIAVTGAAYVVTAAAVHAVHAANHLNDDAAGRGADRGLGPVGSGAPGISLDDLLNARQRALDARK